MPNAGKIIAGAALIAGAVALDVASGGAAGAAGAEEFTAFLAIIGSTGATLVASGTAGLLAPGPVGQGVTTQNPIHPWNIAYGQVIVGGTFVYAESNGGILSNGSNSYNKCTNRVVMLAAHPIKSIDQVRMNGKPLPLGPGGSGAQSTTWTYTPASNQNKTNIASISRSGEVVTIKLVSGIAGQNGLQFNVQNVRDNTFNGIFTVTQPNPSDNQTFTYLCGGSDGTSTGGYIYTCEPDYKNRIHCDLTSCLGNHTSTFPELLSNSTLWTSDHKNLGKASAYLAYYYDAGVFPGGNIPQSSFVISGKNDIYDPRLGDVTNPAAHVYTTNAALIIADYLHNPTWGYNLAYGTDIPTEQLIAAANICDEAVPLAAGGTEPRYTINMGFDLSRSRGEILQDMLNACAGRITIQSGQYIIFPGAWVSPSLSLTAANLIGPIDYKPILTITDSCNGVKGTYTSPVNNWQPGDIPPYAEDQLHGYTAGDKWLAADNGVRIWKDVSFPATTSCPTAQRLAKIDLERLRREGRLTLHCDMSAYTATALDVVEFTYPRYGWNSKTFEVLSSKLVLQSDANGGAPTLGVDLDLAETDSTIYDWSPSEELTPADTPSPVIDSGQTVSGPQFLELESGPSTAYVGADGVVIPRILAAWLAAPDATVQSGGYIQVEYQRVGDTLWTPAGQVSGSQTQCYISNVVSGEQYNVQVQGYTAKGQTSGWAQAGPITVSATATSFSVSNLNYPDGTPVADLQPAQAGADVTALQPIAHTGSGASIVPNGNFLFGNLDGWVGNAIYNGGLLLANNTQAISPTFSVVPGHKYRVTFTGQLNGTGSITCVQRIFYGATYRDNVTDPPYLDFKFDANMPSTSTTFTYDWTCPEGEYFASLGLYQLGTAPLLYTNVAVYDYAAAGEWGADKTGNNTAAGIANQGSLATLNQAGTQNIVAGAVNSQIVWRSTSTVSVPANSSVTIADATLTTQGGYCKITCMVSLAALSATQPSLTIHRGDASGPSRSECRAIAIPSSSSGWLPVAIQAVDTGLDLLQRYTVVLNTGGVAVSAEDITFIVENAKV